MLKIIFYVYLRPGVRIVFLSAGGGRQEMHMVLPDGAELVAVEHIQGK